MKKLFCMIAMAFAVVAANAQKNTSVIFVDEAGNEVPDGSTITYSTVVPDDGFNAMNIPTGLTIKNASDEVQQVRAVMDVKQIPNGSAQVCPFITCQAVNVPGETPSPLNDPETDQPTASPMKAGVTKPLLAEWFPDEGKYGTFIATYRIEIYKAEIVDSKVVYTKIGDGPSVTVNQVYADPTGISGVENSSDVKYTEYFDLAGRKVSMPQHGVYIERATLSDGTVKTVKKTH